jgi:ubiquinone/menaquinone biosynthesis C-methylase UbiE
MFLQAFKALDGLFVAVAEAQSDGTNGARPTEGDIKRRVRTFYDRAATPMVPKVYWNWGMHRAAIQAEIRDKVPNDSDGYCEQLYFYTFKHAANEIAGKPRKVLEVGCGAGAGLNFLSRWEPGSTFVGLDLSQEVVHAANARFSRPPALTYVQGDAEALPFPDGEFDVLLNVESSHNYPNVPQFFREAARVLKPGGCFVHVDLVTVAGDIAIERGRRETKQLFDWVEQEDIAESVRAAITQRMDPKSPFRQQIKRMLRGPARLVFEPMLMTIYGAPFVDQQYGVVPRLFSARLRSLVPATTYRLSVARRSSPLSAE